MKPTVLIVFFIVALLNIWGEQLLIDSITSVTKPLLLPLLILWAGLEIYRNPKPGLKAVHTMLFSAMIAAWAGDVVLLLDSWRPGNLFLAGIGFFAVTQILYTLVFYKIRKGSFFYFHQGLVVVGVLWLVFMLYTWPRIESTLKIPVILYSVLISLMLYQALALWKDNRSTGIILLGASAFYLSDLCIALTRFAGLHFGSIQNGAVIMATYILAQYAIVRGLVKVIKSNVQMDYRSA